MYSPDALSSLVECDVTDDAVPGGLKGYVVEERLRVGLWRGGGVSV